ncbi:thiamine phosphate synthase [Fodinicurvata sediminis]|uniref:thiamine phosphate synthase n=1 Tax=Fodinicurvata sediminis TaxID=1121832 RepID=UPI0003B57BD1|nr:thiamine phosphate synthase [Fodinicurvata sediminis]
MRCRLYLVTPPAFLAGGVEIPDACSQLERALSGGDVAAVLLHSDENGPPLFREALEALVSIIQKAEAAAVLEGDPSLAIETDCDGVQITADPNNQRTLRRKLGDDRILGIDCGPSRHAAMEAGELSADYVMLASSDADLIAWWAELMEVPSVAGGVDNLEAASAAARAGADFIAVGEAIWQHTDGPEAAVAAFNSLLDEEAGEAS